MRRIADLLIAILMALISLQLQRESASLWSTRIRSSLLQDHSAELP